MTTEIKQNLKEAKNFLYITLCTLLTIGLFPAYKNIAGLINLSGTFHY